MTWAGLIPNAGMYGSGVDGDVTVSAGVTTLSRNMHYNNLTVDGTGRIDPNGFEILVRDVLTFADGCEISSIGMNASGFEGGLPTFPGTITGQGSGGNGDVSDFTGSPGAAGLYTISLSGGGGAGGAGDAGPPFGGAAYSAQTAVQGGNSARIHQHFLMETRVYTVAASYVDLSGYGGGGGSGDGVAETGGGGGGTGGAVIVKARKIIGEGAIRSVGGNGADGGTGGGGTGGGGAGPGGCVLVFCDSIDPDVTVASVGGDVGLGQNGGTDGGVATNGVAMLLKAND